MPPDDDRVRNSNVDSVFHDDHNRHLCSCRIYGREKEKQEIIEAYKRVKNTRFLSDVTRSSIRLGRSELVLIRGPTGFGKTSLAQSIRREVEDVDGGYVLCIKFCQMQRSEPHSAFVDAINEFTKRVIDRSEAHTFREIIMKHLLKFDDGRDSLVAAIPILKLILELDADHDTATTTEERSREMGSEESLTGANENVTKSSNGYSTTDGKTIRRLKNSLTMIMRTIASMDKPVTILLDDLHWADEWSLAMLSALLEDGAMEKTLFIGTCREESFVGAKRLNDFLEQLRDSAVRVTRLELTALLETDIECLLRNELKVDADMASRVSSVIAKRTRGIAFFVWKYLHHLFTEDLIRLDEASGTHVIELEDVIVEEFDIDGYIRARMNGLSSSDQEHMKLIACVGSTVDDKVLRCLLSYDDNVFTTFTTNAMDKGLLCYDSSCGLWCFMHDLIQELIYGLIPTGEQASYHFRIGQILWRMFTAEELNQYIFLVVEKLTSSIEGLENKKERVAVATLCLDAGVRAVQLSSFHTSIRYLEDGIVLLSVMESWRDEYSLSLDLHNAAAEVANSLGNFKRVSELFDIVQQNGRGFDDMLRAHAAMVHAFGSSGRYADAVDLACVVLEKLGEPLPTGAAPLRVLVEFIALRRRLRRKTNEAIMRLPYMVDDKKLAAMQILNLAFPYALVGRADLVPHIGFRMVRLTLDYGLSAVSCVGFVLFAGSVCGFGNDVKEGYRIGRISFLLYEKFDSKAWLARLSVLYYDFVHGWVKPLAECREELASACQAGLESGDVQFALSCEVVAFSNTFETIPLQESAYFLDRIIERMKSYNQSSTTLLFIAQRQLIENLIGQSDGNPLVLEGKFMDAETLQNVKSNKMLEAGRQVLLAVLHCLFGHYTEAATYAKHARVLATRMFGPKCVSSIVFMCGFVDVVYARHKRHWWAPYAQRCSKQLKRSAEEGEPLNFIGEHYLLEAEIAALSGNVSKALSLYITAISTLQKGRHIFPTAMANERTARFLMEQNDRGRALPYFQEAIVWYKKWGASAKVEHLREEICDLNFDSGFIACL